MNRLGLDRLGLDSHERDNLGLWRVEGLLLDWDWLHLHRGTPIEGCCIDIWVLGIPCFIGVFPLITPRGAIGVCITSR